MTRTYFLVSGRRTLNRFLLHDKGRTRLLQDGIDPARDGVYVDIGDDWQQLGGVRSVVISSRITRMPREDAAQAAELWVRAG